MKNEPKELKKLLLDRPSGTGVRKEMEPKAVYAVERTIKLENGDTLPIAVFQNCDSSGITTLFWSENNPVLAIELYFQYANIHWSAGRGWPEYYVPAPNGLAPSGTGFNKPNLGRHAIICEFGNEDFQTPVLTGGGRGQYLSEVKVFVNDDQVSR